MRPSKRWRGSTRWSSTEMTVNATSAAGGSGSRPVAHRVPDSRQLAVPLVPAGRGGGATVVGLDPVARAGPAAGIGRVGLEAGGHPGEVRRAEGRALRAPRRRRPAARCRRPAPASRSALCTPPPVATMRRASAPPEVDDVAHRERRALVGRPPDGRRAHPDVEVVQRGPAVGVVQRHPLARAGTAARPGSRRGRAVAGRAGRGRRRRAAAGPSPGTGRPRSTARRSASCPAWCGARSRRRRPRPTPA